jgi:glycosyltransferase involved in cell wall biosynthesis
MVTDKLELILITYNRADFLHSTLVELYSSPFKGCRITILDNNSSDRTAEVCAEFVPKFPYFTVIRHRLNIGGNANYLRAVELATAEYTWIVCDDDTFDFSSAGEVFREIENGAADLILLRPVTDGGVVRTGHTSARELIEAGFMYYFSLSFYPALIFRTSLFDSNSLMYGYRLISESYSQFGFINHSVQENFSIFIPEQPLVVRNDVNVSTFSPLSWYKAWLFCCSTIPDRAVRWDTVHQATRLRGFIKSLAFWIALEKKINKTDFYQKVSLVFLLLDPAKKLVFLLFIPLILIPLPYSFLLVARKMVYKMLGVPDEQVPPVEFDQQL